MYIMCKKKALLQGYSLFDFRTKYIYLTPDYTPKQFMYNIHIQQVNRDFCQAVGKTTNQDYSYFCSKVLYLHRKIYVLHKDL